MTEINSSTFSEGKFPLKMFRLSWIKICEMGEIWIGSSRDYKLKRFSQKHVRGTETNSNYIQPHTYNTTMKSYKTDFWSYGLKKFLKAIAFIETKRDN